MFAIAITLLVLDLRLPEDTTDFSNAQLFTALTRLGPTYLAFFITFAFTGIMWINHHRLFTHITRADTWLQVFNLALLLGVTMGPFPTAVLADHLGHPAETLAAGVYNGLFDLIAVVFNLLWRYAATNNHLLDPQADRAAVRRIKSPVPVRPDAVPGRLPAGVSTSRSSLLVSLLLAVLLCPPQPAPGPR